LRTGGGQLALLGAERRLMLSHLVLRRVDLGLAGRLGMALQPRSRLGGGRGERHEHAAPHHHAQAAASAEPIPDLAPGPPYAPHDPATPGFRPVTLPDVPDY